MLKSFKLILIACLTAILFTACSSNSENISVDSNSNNESQLSANELILKAEKQINEEKVHNIGITKKTYKSDGNDVLTTRSYGIIINNNPIEYDLKTEVSRQGVPLELTRNILKDNILYTLNLETNEWKKESIKAGDIKLKDLIGPTNFTEIMESQNVTPNLDFNKGANDYSIYIVGNTKKQPKYISFQLIVENDGLKLYDSKTTSHVNDNITYFNNQFYKVKEGSKVTVPSEAISATTK